MRKGVVQLYIKNNEMIFSLAWNIIFSDNFKVLVLKFLEIKNMVFLSQKVDGNMIFTDYWKVLVLIILGMGNTVFFDPKVDGKMIFTDYWNVLVLNFLMMEKYGLSLSQEVDGKMIFTAYWEVLVLNVSVIGNTVFFWSKNLMERLYLLGLFELSIIFQDLENMVFRAV